MLSDIIIRRLAPGDLTKALAIQTANYPAFLCEDAAAFASRLSLPASYCLAAVKNDEIVAYLLAHGWASGSPPCVGTILTPGPADVLFIHDLAVSAAGQGVGLGQRLIDRAFELARDDGLRIAELIAIEGAAGYWSRLGFVESAVSPALSAKVAGYGAEARWMTREIPQS